MATNPNQQSEDTIYNELGSVGLKRYAGRIYEEFLAKLQTTQKIKTYEEMRLNEPIITAFLTAIELTIREATRIVHPASEQNADMQAKEWLEGVFDDMSFTWDDFLSECLTFLPFGFSFFEIIYKKRLGHKPPPVKPTADYVSNNYNSAGDMISTDCPPSSKFNDGKIGIRKLGFRAQDTLWRWNFDDTGGLQAMVQLPPPDFIQRTVPIDKGVLFRTRVEKNNPEGRSILRGCFIPYMGKKAVQQIELIGIERDLAGYPVLYGPDGVDMFDPNQMSATTLSTLKNSVTRIRRDEDEGMVLNYGMKLELLSAAGNRQFNTTEVINRLNREMATSVLAQFLLLGTDKGSFALSKDQSDLFLLALNTYADIICSAFNRYVIPRLFELNNFNIDKLPRLDHAQIGGTDITALADFIQKTVSVGALTPDHLTEQQLRKVSDLPEMNEDAPVAPAAQVKSVTSKQQWISQSQILKELGYDSKKIPAMLAELEKERASRRSIGTSVLEAFDRGQDND